MYDCDWYQFLYILSKEYNVTNVDEKIYELKYMHTKTGKCCLTTKYWFTILIEEGDVVYDVLSELVESIIHLSEYIPYMNNSKEFKNMLTYLLITHIAPAIKLYRESGDVYNSTIDLLGLLIQKGYMSELK